jgi:hypothetical protein
MAKADQFGLWPELRRHSHGSDRTRARRAPRSALKCAPQLAAVGSSVEPIVASFYSHQPAQAKKAEQSDPAIVVMIIPVSRCPRTSIDAVLDVNIFLSLRRHERSDAGRFIVRADQELPAFLELESAIRACDELS